MAPLPRPQILEIPRQATTLVESRHPEYDLSSTKWQKWRYAYEAGEDFITKYMVKLSSRESDDEFADRKSIAYAPAFAGAAIDDIKNAIFQRIADVRRAGGPPSYQNAIKGLDGGVDLQNSSLNSYIGTEIINELLIMSKVGILVDNFADLGMTLADKGDKRPYLDVFYVEDILNWYPRNPINGFQKLLLRELVDTYNSFGLPEGTEYRYRYYHKTDDGVVVLIYNAKGKNTEEYFLDLDQIPFVQFKIPQSLMEKVADYQIALLNLESSDISFVRKANFPFYYEFFDPKINPPFLKGPAIPDETGTQAAGEVSKAKEIKVGLTQGRKFPLGARPPGFINPDPDTLRVSMEKEEVLKEDIRLLVSLTLQNMNPRRQASDSKAMDAHSLESSLSFIGLVLEKGENEIGKFWREFEGDGDVVHVAYPKSYSLKTDAQRLEEAEKLEKLMNKIPSETYRRAIATKIALITVERDLTESDLEEIRKEIQDAETLTVDPNVIISAHKAGLVDDVTASTAVGFDGEEVIPKAKKDRAERIKETMEAQGGMEGASGARGAPEFDKGTRTSEQEKEGQKKRGQQNNAGVS